MQRAHVLAVMTALTLAGCAPLPDPADGCGRAPCQSPPPVPATGCTALEPDSGGGTYQAGHAGEVTVYRYGDEVRQTSSRAAKGWSYGDWTDTTTALTVSFTRGDEVVEFRAQVTGDLLETEYCYTVD